MGKFIIEGGHKLSGEITPQGAKNEALEVISAVLLTADPVVISNVPEILDVKNLIGLLQGMGVKVQRLEKGTYRFQADEVDTAYIETEEFVKKCAALRGSVMVVGPLRARVVCEAGRRQDRPPARGYAPFGHGHPGRRNGL